MGLLIGCSGDDSPEQAEVSNNRDTTSSSTTTTEPSTTTTTAAPTATTEAPTTTTTAPPTTTTAPPPPEPAPPEPAPGSMLRQGDSGDAVLGLQQRLNDLGYWVGVDGTYGQTTQQAVLAFQKAEGLGRDGVAGPETQGHLAGAGRVTAASTEGDLIEIDVGRQLLFVIDDGQVVWAFNTSTGKSSTPTPSGNFSIDREIDGYRHAELGVLYRPKYFNGGIAIHGFPSIPASAASHGCTRVSNPAMDWLWASGYAGIGTPVWVH